MEEPKMSLDLNSYTVDWMLRDECGERYIYWIVKFG